MLDWIKIRHTLSYPFVPCAAVERANRGRPWFGTFLTSAPRRSIIRWNTTLPLLVPRFLLARFLANPLTQLAELSSEWNTISRRLDFFQWTPNFFARFTVPVQGERNRDRIFRKESRTSGESCHLIADFVEFFISNKSWTETKQDGSFLPVVIKHTFRFGCKPREIIFIIQEIYSLDHNSLPKA